MSTLNIISLRKAVTCIQKWVFPVWLCLTYVVLHRALLSLTQHGSDSVFGCSTLAPDGPLLASSEMPSVDAHWAASSKTSQTFSDQESTDKLMRRRSEQTASHRDTGFYMEMRWCKVHRLSRHNCKITYCFWQPNYSWISLMGVILVKKPTWQN